MNLIKSAIVLSLVVLMGGCEKKDRQTINNTSSTDTQHLVYGEDDRLEVSQASSSLQVLANSTVALVKSGNVNRTSQTTYLSDSSYGSNYGLCSHEPFYSQPNPAHCSGFLVESNKIVTAGHCIPSQSSCNETLFVFDFHNKASNSATVAIPNENVFSCTRLLGREERSNGADWAIVEIDRPAIGRAPLEVRKASEGRISQGESLVVIGHPAGLPTKIAGGATVRTVLSEHLVANLDTYGGNSGSAVFNQNSLKVEGILVRGERDFVSSGSGCRVSNHCPDSGCAGEDVTLITEVCGIGSQTCDSPSNPGDGTGNGGPNSCQYANDGVCDDGRPGAPYNVCERGTDENDCAGPTEDRGNSCQYANDGVCDDGRPGSAHNVCERGTDENDCSSLEENRANSCQYANDGVCDDGRPGAAHSVCERGTDENDCSAFEDNRANSCQYANDGVCDDGRPGAPYSVCERGTDTNDCGD